MFTKLTRAMLLSILVLGLCAFETWADKVFSKDDIVRSILDDNKQPVSELKWGISEVTYNQIELFVAVHAGEQNKAAVYVKRGKDEYHLLLELQAGFSYFEKPNIFWYGSNGKKEHLIQLTEVMPGTGHYITEHIYAVNWKGGLVKVAFTPAPKSFTTNLNKDEGIWKGETNRLSKEGLSFEFYIWNKGDANCCPTGGKVSGKYKLTVKEYFSEKSYEMVMDTYERESYKP